MAASVFLLYGIGGIVTFFFGLWTRHLYIGTDIVGFFAYAGLLRLSRGWRVYALVNLWCTLVVTLLAVTCSLIEKWPNLALSIWGVPVGDIPSPAFLAICTVLFILSGLQLLVLEDPKIRELFVRKKVESQKTVVKL